MRPESVVFAVAGTCFGLVVGWILGSQQAAPARVLPPVAQQAATPQSTEPATRQPAPLDDARVQALKTAASNEPKNPRPRIELANLLFDAERYDEASKWYEEALKIEPRDADVSTDLGVSYYYTNQPDRALKQFDYSLSVNPRHAKTILNQGIVRAFGKQDLDGAAAAWRQVIEIAPGSPEARAAQRALDSMKSAHPGLGGTG